MPHHRTICCGLFFSAALLLAASPEAPSSRAASAQAAAPPVPARAADAAGFVPADWRILGEAKGDLNGDALPDLALALGSKREEGAAPDVALPPRLLLVARAEKGSAGGYRRAVLDRTAVLDRNDGGVFGDPFADLRIERGALVLEHYGGSRDRWGYTDRFRLRRGAWEQIGHTYTSTDSLQPERSRTRDVNLSTGRVEETESGGEGKPGTRSRIYHEVPVAPAQSAPQTPPANASLGRFVRLSERADVVTNAAAWRGPADLSATFSAVTHGGSLFLRALVRDDRRAPGGDSVRLVDARGNVIAPAASGSRTVPGGYVWQGRYPLSTLGVRSGRVLEIRREDAPRGMGVARDGSGGGDYVETGFPASVEIVDTDAAGRPAKVLSTSRSGRTSAARLRFARAAALPRLGDPNAAFYSE